MIPSPLFQEVLDLVEKTGDRCVMIHDNMAFAIMGLPQYRSLLLGERDIIGLSEAELLEKINRDIARWRSAQVEEGIDMVSDYDRIEQGINE